MHLSVAFEMLANGNCLLNEVVEVFRDDWRQSFSLQNAEDLVAGDKTHLSNAVRVSQNHTCDTCHIFTAEANSNSITAFNRWQFGAVLKH